MLILLIACSLVYADSKPRFLGQALLREASFSSIRLEFHPIMGAFSESHEQELLDRIIPSVKLFYSSALKVNRVIYPLKPKITTCGSVEVPEEHRFNGLEADIIIYLNTISLPVSALGRSCETEGGTYKRPIVGYINLDISNFFFLYEDLQIQYLIRETAHVIALDTALFPEFVDLSGTKYEDSRYLTLINYPNRGVTVKAIGFPYMLQRAREAFDCEVEGVEYEDNFEFEGLENEAFFWDARIMTHDIMSSYMSDEVVFSDITMALIEDSGWYLADFSYSQKLKWGYKAGCAWFEEKCIKQEKASFKGFCDKSTNLNECDVFNLGYGNCLITYSENIPPHEQYFQDKKLGGREIIDYCPTIVVPQVHKCRDPDSFPRNIHGESKNAKSRCFINSLVRNSEEKEAKTPEGGCYTVESCTETSVTVKVGDILTECPYNSKITVPGFKGYFHCPSDSSFCQNIPCMNLCSGKGKCINGLCTCNSNWSGDDCSISCGVSCKSCDFNKKCLVCTEGFVFHSGVCIPCSPDCKTCITSTDLCTSCFKGSELVNSRCKKNCLNNCASCDNPCTKCDDGYFLAEGKCSECSPNCQTCGTSSEICTSCFEGFELNSFGCQVSCIEGCVECENPCRECKIGYFLQTGICKFCNNLCKTCTLNPDHCTSCLPGFNLLNSTCKQSCKEHCLTCDDPCSLCEDGYLSKNGICEACDGSCQTCADKTFFCTSCRDGFHLVGASCEKGCAQNCETCEGTCKKCKAGFYLEFNECSKCDDNCKTCSMVSMFCNSCHEGFGLIHNSCEKGCMDHCYSCTSPCTNCEMGYYGLNGVCIKCDSACMACTGLGNDKCIHCAEGYYKENSVCKPTCQEHCLSCDEPCTICETGYFNFENGCSKCSSTCLTCHEKFDFCISCQAGFGLISNTCKKGCKDHCESCNTPCSKCESGFILVNNECLHCNFNCLTCINSPTQCSSCHIGYALIGNICQSSCLPDCVTCDNPCTLCQKQYVSKNGLCVKCPEGCESCSSEDNECYSCVTGYTYSEKACNRNCAENCKSCDDPCTECKSGYLLLNNECTACEYPCQSCYESLSYCTSCPVLYTLYSGVCTSNCLEHCLSCDSPCSKCQEGFLPFQGICEPCSIKCRTCAQSPNVCTSCRVGQVLQSGECVSTCIENCVDCSVPCKACKEGYNLQDYKCELCKKYLESENIMVEFIMDYTGIAVTFDYPVLNTVNKCNVYFKAVTLAMLGNGPLCTWEEPDRLILVFGKNPEYRIKSLEMFPILTYGSDCTSKPSEIIISITEDTFPNPTISISAPNFFTLGCDNEVLVIEAITEERIYKLEVNTEPRIKEIEDFIKALPGKYFSIPESILKPVILNITFSASNFLGKTSTVTKNIIVTTDSKLSISIDAGSHIRLANSKSFTIRGVLPQTSCVNYEQLTYQWRYIESPGSSKILNSDELIKSSKLNYVLKVKPGDLPVGSHVFRFVAFDRDHHDFSDIQIDVIESQLVAVLSRSDGSADVNKEFKLSAKGSYDPGNSNTLLKFEWECMQETQPCLDSMGEHLLQDVFVDEILIGSHRMVPSSKYIFTVKVSKGNRISTRSVVIEANLVFGEILIPTIENSINIQSELAVFPSFELDNKDYAFKWAQLNGPALKTKSSLLAPYIILSPNSMITGMSYTFMLKASANNETVYSSLHWTANSGPKCEEIQGTAIGNSVTLSISCFDSDYNDFPLYYIYGIKTANSNVPLKVVHSPSVTFKLNPGNLTLYIQICDSLQTCLYKEKSVRIQNRNLQEVENIRKYKTEKVFPDNIPLAIFNSKENFDTENFDEAFEDLKTYITSQDLDLIHLKMAIESLEILTSSNKKHFMQNKQVEIVEFLNQVVSKLDFIDDEVMEYIVKLFSEHTIQHYSQVSKLICAFSERWVKSLPPGELVAVSNKISLIRHRFIGTEYKSEYNLGSITVSNLALEANTNKIYDLLITVFPDSPSSIIDVTYYDVGTYKDYNIKLSDSIKEVEIELIRPFNIEFKTKHPGQFTCAQLKDHDWVDEGCKVVNTTEDTVIISSWHVSTYRVVSTSSTKSGYSALIVVIAQLIITIGGVAVFCILDKNKLNYVPAQSIEFESPRASGKLRSNEESPESPSEEASNGISALIFHPSFNFVINQNADRRPASVLYLSAVLLAEFNSIGGMFNPKFKEIFDADDKFTGFSNAQVTTFCVGIVLSQFLSGGILFLNQPGDYTITKRYLGMAVCALFIVFGSGLGIVLALEYPAIYSFYWMCGYLIVVFLELTIMQSFFWLVSYNIFKKGFGANIGLNTRNIRVFTSDA